MFAGHLQALGSDVLVMGDSHLVLEAMVFGAGLPDLCELLSISLPCYVTKVLSDWAFNLVDNGEIFPWQRKWSPQAC